VVSNSQRRCIPAVARGTCREFRPAHWPARCGQSCGIARLLKQLKQRFSIQKWAKREGFSVRLARVSAPSPNAARRSIIAHFGIFQADVEAHELRKHGRRVRLQDQPFAVLAALLEHPGVVITREELRERLWPADTFVDFDHSLNTTINKNSRSARRFRD